VFVLQVPVKNRVTQKLLFPCAAVSTNYLLIGAILLRLVELPGHRIPQANVLSEVMRVGELLVRREGLPLWIVLEDRAGGTLIIEQNVFQDQSSFVVQDQVVKDNAALKD